MLPSTGYFKGISCPFYDSGLCERPYCHFRHAKRDSQNTERDNIESEEILQKLVSAAVQKVLQQTEKSTTSVTQTTTTDQATESAKNNVVLTVSKVTYNPTPISELNKINTTDVETTEEHEQRKRHIPVPYTPRKPTSVPLRKPETNGSFKPYIYIPPQVKYTPGCTENVQCDSYTPPGSTESKEKYLPGTEKRLQEYTPNDNPQSKSSVRNYIPSDKSFSKTKILEYQPTKVTTKKELQSVTYQPTPRSLAPCFSSDEEEPDTKKRKLSSDLNGLDELGPEFDILDQILDEETHNRHSKNKVKKVDKDKNVRCKADKGIEDLQTEYSVRSNTETVADEKNTKLESKKGKSFSEYMKSNKIMICDSTKKQTPLITRENNEHNDEVNVDVTKLHKETSKTKSHKNESSISVDKEKNKFSKKKSKHNSSSKDRDKERISDKSKHKKSNRHSERERHTKDKDTRDSKHSSSKSESRNSKSSKSNSKNHKSSKHSKEKYKNQDKTSSDVFHNHHSDENTDEHYSLSDLDEEAIALECKKIFEEYVPTAKVNTEEDAPQIEDINHDEEYIPGKKRISRTNDKNTKVIKKLPVKPNFKVSAVHAMTERLAKVKEFHNSRNISLPTSTDSISNKIDLLKNNFSAHSSGHSKIRIAHVPYASTLMHAKKDISTIHSTSRPDSTNNPSTSTTITQTVKKGAQRVAHIPNEKFIDRPGVLEPLSSKITANIRSIFA